MGLAGAVRRASRWACVALTPVIQDKVDNTEATSKKLEYEASLWGNLPEAIEKAGGRDRLLRCGSVYSGPFQTQMVAYELGIHGIDVASLAPTVPPGVAFQTHTVPRRPARGHRRDRRPVPHRGHELALAGAHRAAFRCHRKGLSRRRSRRTPGRSRRPDPRTRVLALTIFP